MSDKVIGRYFLRMSTILVIVCSVSSFSYGYELGFLTPHRPIVFSRSLQDHTSAHTHHTQDIPIVPIHRRVFVLNEILSSQEQQHEHQYKQHHNLHYFLAPRGKNFRESSFESEGCLGGRLERLYEKTGSCYTLGTQGPCGPKMVFQTLPNNNRTHGTCDCDTESYERPLVRSKNKCYFLYTQAYCGSGKWLGVNEDGFPQCETNPCQTKDSKSSNGWVLFHGKCVRLNSKSKHCKRNQVVTFVRGKLHPLCSEWLGSFPPMSMSTRRVNRQVAKVGNLKCRSGKKYSPLLKKCVRMFSFRRS